MSFLYWGIHSWTQYTGGGFMRAESSPLTCWPPFLCSQRANWPWLASWDSWPSIISVKTGRGSVWSCLRVTEWGRGVVGRPWSSTGKMDSGQQNAWERQWLCWEGLFPFCTTRFILVRAVRPFVSSCAGRRQRLAFQMLQLVHITRLALCPSIGKIVQLLCCSSRPFSEVITLPAIKATYWEFC